MILLVGGEKGGTGKTTVATNIAALRAIRGHDVLLVDTDPQGSASNWAALRDEEEHQPRVASVAKFGKGLGRELQELAGRYGDVIVDAGGRDSVELRAALVVADLVYSPVQASQFDLWTIERFAELIEQARGFHPELQARLLLSRASTNPSVSEANEARELLVQFEGIGLANPVLRDRIAYRKAAREGLSIAEYDDAKARAEVEALYEEIFTHG